MAAYTGDPNFPQRIRSSSKRKQAEFLRNLYTRYSGTVFFSPSDRPLAICSVESRIRRALNVEGDYGVFNDETLLPLTLCWVRAADEHALTPIAYREGQTALPSWSCLAYKGRIDYFRLPAQINLHSKPVLQPNSGISSLSLLERQF